MRIGLFRNRLQCEKFSIDRCFAGNIDAVVSKGCQVEFLVLRRLDKFVAADEAKEFGYRLKKMTRARFQVPWLCALIDFEISRKAEKSRHGQSYRACCCSLFTTHAFDAASTLRASVTPSQFQLEPNR